MKITHALVDLPEPTRIIKSYECPMQILKAEDLQKIKKEVILNLSHQKGRSRAKINFHMRTRGIGAGAEKLQNSLS